MSSTDEELLQLLAQYVEAPVECDGFALLAHTALMRAGIEHFCLCGRLESQDGNRGIPAHFWIELVDGRIIDYRARMWLGALDSVPHGIFDANMFPEWTYQGEHVALPTLHPALVEIMMTPIPSFD